MTAKVIENISDIVEWEKVFKFYLSISNNFIMQSFQMGRYKIVKYGI